MQCGPAGGSKDGDIIAVTDEGCPERKIGSLIDNSLRGHHSDGLSLLLSPCPDVRDYYFNQIKL